MLNIKSMLPSPIKAGVVGAIIIVDYVAEMFFYDMLCRNVCFAKKMIINYNFFIWLGSFVEPTFLLHWILATQCLVLLLNTLQRCMRSRNDQLDKIRLKENSDFNDLLRVYEEFAETNDSYSPRPRIQMDFINNPGGEGDHPLLVRNQDLADDCE